MSRLRAFRKMYRVYRGLRFSRYESMRRAWGMAKYA